MTGAMLTPHVTARAIGFAASKNAGKNDWMATNNGVEMESETGRSSPARIAPASASGRRRQRRLRHTSGDEING
jgi:hypothetical protein